MKRLLSFLILSVSSVFAVLIPTDQLTDWTPGTKTGVIGGIPTTRTQFVDATQPPYNADKNGINDSTSAIQGALNACPANQFVYLPAGTYKVGQLTMNRDNVTLRGAGMDVTILRHQGGGSGILVGSGISGSDYFPGKGPGQTVTAGNSRDSTVVTLADTSAFTVGKLARLAWSDMIDDTTLDDGTTYVVTSVNGPTYNGRVRRQVVKVTAKTATTVTFTPGIIHTVQTGTNLTILAGSANFGWTGIGLEDFTLNSVDSPTLYGIDAGRLMNSWFKNVKSINSTNYPFIINESLNVEMLHCYAAQVGGGGTNGAGILFETSTACLLYDNIITQSFPALEMNSGSCGNVFAYNLCDGNSSAYCNINVNHSAHNSHNLFEGNIAMYIQSDGYHGSASQLIYFRNWLHGTTVNQSFNGPAGVVFNRWNSHNSAVGNLLGFDTYPSSIRPISLGNPNMGNASFTGNYNMRLNSFPADWRKPASLVSGAGTNNGTINVPSSILTVGQHFVTVFWNTRANWRKGSIITSQSGTNYGFDGDPNAGAAGDLLPANGTTLEVWPGQEGFQGQDQGTFSIANNGTTTLKANYFLKTGFTGWPAEEDLGGDTIPNSLYLSAKPTFFGNLSWPPFDPQAPGSLTFSQRVQRIPAGYRYVNGVDPPASGVPSLVSATIQSSGTSIVLVFSSAVDFQSGDTANFAFSLSGGAVTMSSPSGSGTTSITCTLSRTVNSNETGSVSYTQPGNGVEDLSGNDLPSFSNFALINSSTQGPLPTPTPSPTPGPGGSGSLTTPIINLNTLRVK